MTTLTIEVDAFEERMTTENNCANCVYSRCGTQDSIWCERFESPSRTEPFALCCYFQKRDECVEAVEF